MATSPGSSNPHADHRIPIDFESQWRSRFEEFADARDDDAGIAGWSSTGLDARIRQFMRFWASPRRKGCWLDAGCGAGTYSRLLRDRGLQVVGTDYSFPTLRKAMQRETVSASYVVADVRRLPFADSTFDGALCLGVTQALSRSDEAVSALAAVVRSGGEVWIDALNRWCVTNLYDTLHRRLIGRRMHLRYESPRVLEQLMRDHGFRDIRLYWIPLFPSRLKRVQPILERPVARRIFSFIPLAGLLLCHSFVVKGERWRPGPE